MEVNKYDISNNTGYQKDKVKCKVLHVIVEVLFDSRRFRHIYFREFLLVFLLSQSQNQIVALGQIMFMYLEQSEVSSDSLSGGTQSQTLKTYGLQ